MKTICNWHRSERDGSVLSAKHQKFEKKNGACLIHKMFTTTWSDQQVAPPVWWSMASISSPSSISSSWGVCSARRRRPSKRNAIEEGSTDCRSQYAFISLRRVAVLLILKNTSPPSYKTLILRKLPDFLPRHMHIKTRLKQQRWSLDGPTDVCFLPSHNDLPHKFQPATQLPKPAFQNLSELKLKKSIYLKPLKANGRQNKMFTDVNKLRSSHLSDLHSGSRSSQTNLSINPTKLLLFLLCF